MAGFRWVQFCRCQAEELGIRHTLAWTQQCCFVGLGPVFSEHVRFAPPMSMGKLYPQEVRNAFTHVKKRISEGIAPLTSSSGVLTFSMVQATARLMHSPTNLYPLMNKCTKSLERIHSSILQMAQGGQDYAGFHALHS